MKEILQLSRWKEHIPYTVPLTVLGAIIASSSGATALNYKLLILIIANVLTMSYAFMLNDIEDAEDDARDSHKAKRNPITAGRIDKDDAYTLVRVIAIIALVLYSMTDRITFGLGIVTVLLSHLYSWRKVRLKAYPVTDILSHSLMLSGLLILTGFTAFSREFKEIWALAAAATLFSVYGQIYNQIRDYEVDAKAKLRNTTILVGKRKAEYIKNASILLAAVALLTAIYFRTFPVWLLLPVAVSAPFIFSAKGTKDSSGTIAIDLTGKLQVQMLLIFNVIVLSWLVQVILSPFVSLF